MSDSRLLLLEPEVQPLAATLLKLARARFPKTVVASTRRTCAEQNAIYAQGRTKPGPVVTQARGCMSWHVVGRAMDLNLGSTAKGSDYAALGKAWVAMGGKWGGDFGDPGHFEYHPGMVIESVCPNPDDCRNTLPPVFYGFPGLALKSAGFRCELWAVGKRLSVDPNWLAAVIYSESGFDSKIRNAWCLKTQACAPLCCAVGLIQFMPVAASAVGTTTTALYNMSDVEQLTYVEKFYQPHRAKLKRPVDLYMATFLPAFVGSPGTKVLGKKNDVTALSPGLTLAQVYAANEGFDPAKRGYFTVDDVGGRVNAILEAARVKPSVPVDCTSPKGLPAGPAPSAPQPLSYSASGALPTLRLGMQGPAVELWQRILHTIADGKFGEGTDTLTRKWQAEHGLKPDGEVGPKTWGKAP